MTIAEQVTQQAKAARKASRQMALVSTDEKNQCLLKMAAALETNSSVIQAANEQDLAMAREKGFSQALLDRLMINDVRITDMAEGLRQVAALKDPIGEGSRLWTGADGIQISQVRTPMGVVGMIYEARPNVTVDAAALCLKSGNAVILKGGSEAIHTNTAIAGVLKSAMAESALPVEAVQLIESTSREAVNVLMKLNGLVDVLIPRGGAGLIKTVVEQASVPVIETGVGNCHIFVDASADPAMATAIAVNGKTHRPAVCNATETLLVHERFAREHLESLTKPLLEKGVELRGCPVTCSLVPAAVPASEEDWSTEFLDLILAVKVVASLDEAIDHIETYGTRHSEAIVTEEYSHARRFLQEVDAATVYVNASTRYTDGFQFGFGAEIGISTQKLHARGPMGLEALTSIKYMVMGNGQIRK
ncbi:glutamate-5-semialdehyde dehydrogenase [Anoxynatronum buryatiense]|uniref:Gamma-glutamyl phosphate reductase n=1 Tax=Anoxynatronum buryatiense TaxID=489973 RepID=A0AA46AHV0_9CLOT|nr:glutamate-5-semialdehyde dehydrogenase [Anoxynatronum buryatiense]SMP43813.1 glutamate-5-semialdehyde dehydrogenase [Anoxynatronum buryatiense]